MAKLFRMLLMVAQGGFRYLRGIFRSVVGVDAKASTAPSSDIEADLGTVTGEFKSEGVALPTADGSIQGKAGGIKMLAEIISKLVSDAIFNGTAVDVSMGTSMDTPPAADGKGNCRADTPMTAQAGAPPGIPMDFDTGAEINLTAEPVATPPEHMAATPVHQIRMSAAPAPASPREFTADLGARIGTITATVVPGVAADTWGRLQAGTASLSAHMHTWNDPTRDGTTIYIPQVYSFQREGSTLKIM